MRDVAFSPDGGVIYYTTRDGLYAVEMTTETEVTPGTEPRVELGAPELVGSYEWGPVRLTPQRDAGSERFLATRTEGASESQLVVVQDWASRLEER